MHIYIYMYMYSYIYICWNPGEIMAKFWNGKSTNIHNSLSPQYSMMWCDVPQYKTMWYGATQYDCYVMWDVRLCYGMIWYEMIEYNRRLRKKQHNLMLSLALQSSSKNCYPAPDLMSCRLVVPCFLFSGGVSFSQAPVWCDTDVYMGIWLYVHPTISSNKKFNFINNISLLNMK